jgi:ABC-type transport system involved in multi-copper enzyme maturation permease subunit
MKSEIYRLFQEKSYRIFIMAFSLLSIAHCIVVNVMSKLDPSFPYANTRYLFTSITSMMVIPFFFVYIISQILVGEEMKHHTLKNSVSFGVSRRTIYFGKWVVSVLGLLIVAIITITLSIAFAYLLSEDSGISYLTDFIWSILGMVPIMLVALTTFHFLYFVSLSSNYVLMFFTGIHFLPYIVGKFLGIKYEIFNWIYCHTPVYLLLNKEFIDRHMIMAGNTTSGMINCWLVCGVLTLIFIIVGYVQFKKMDIK